MLNIHVRFYSKFCFVTWSWISFIVLFKIEELQSKIVELESELHERTREYCELLDMPVAERQHLADHLRSNLATSQEKDVSTSSHHPLQYFSIDPVGLSYLSTKNVQIQLLCRIVLMVIWLPNIPNIKWFLCVLIFRSHDLIIWSFEWSRKMPQANAFNWKTRIYINRVVSKSIPLI